MSKYIKEQLGLVNKKRSSLKKVNRIYNKPHNKTKLITLCKKWWKLAKTTWSDNQLEICSIYKDEVTLDSTWCHSDTFSYEELLEMEGVDFSSMYYGGQYVPSIAVNYEMSIIIDGIKFKMGQRFEVKIPADDLATLRILGKVKDEVISASVNTSVFCEFG